MATDATNTIATTAANTAGMRFIWIPPDRGIDSVEHSPSNGHSTWGQGPPTNEKRPDTYGQEPGAHRERQPGQPPKAGAGARAGRRREAAARGAAGRGAGRDSP